MSCIINPVLPIALWSRAGSGVEEVPGALAQAKEFFPLLARAHAMSPVVFFSARGMALELAWMDSRGTTVVALVLVPTSSSAGDALCAAEVRARLEVAGRHLRGVRVVLGRVARVISVIARIPGVLVVAMVATWRGRCWGLSTTVVDYFGKKFLSSRCHTLNRLLSTAELPRSRARWLRRRVVVVVRREAGTLHRRVTGRWRWGSSGSEGCRRRCLHPVVCKDIGDGWQAVRCLLGWYVLNVTRLTKMARRMWVDVMLS